MRSKKIRNERIGMALLCGVLLLGGCGSKDDQETLAGTEEVLHEEAAKENAAREEASTAEGQEAERSDDMQADLAGASENAGKDRVIIEMGPDKKVWREGNLICTLHDFRLYNTIQDASINEEQIIITDARDYADQSIFLLMQADINNLDDPGDGEDGTINVSMFTIEPKEQTENNIWGVSYPVYVSEPGRGETDYYHVAVAKGETKSVAIGFFVPMKDAEELRAQCRLVISGCYDEGYVYEIPVL